jgi:uncharacterized integral membrane protein
MTKRYREAAGLRARRRMTAADIVATALIVAAGVVFLILAMRSVPAWWATKFELPGRILITLALVSGAFIAFLISWFRLTQLLLSEYEKPYITRIGDGAVSVAEGSVADRPMLRRLGGRRDFVNPWSWSFRAPDEPTLARVLTALRDAGVAFAGNDPKGWTPSDEFLALRERGVVSGSFDEMTVGGGRRKR